MRKLALVFLLLLSLSFAAPLLEKIGVYVINAGKFDPETGVYPVDFYLSMACNGNCSKNFEFTNGRATSVDETIDKPGEKFYRMQANLRNPVDFSKYPFDSHTLTIEMEEKLLTKENLVYAADTHQTGLDPSIQFTGWKIKGWNATVRDHYYEPYNETYSRYVFSIVLERDALPSLLKIFFPMLLIMLPNFFAHFLHTRDILTRITVHISLLIALVLFHVAVLGQLPPLGYLTVADKFICASYLSLGFSLLSAILILRFEEERKMEAARKVHWLSGITSFFLWVSALVFVLLTM